MEPLTVILGAAVVALGAYVLLARRKRPPTIPPKPDWRAESDHAALRVHAHQDAIADALKITRPPRCTRPSVGWYCTREPGHGGPCAAHPIPDPHAAPHLGGRL